jgi:hypothetical protein
MSFDTSPMTAGLGVELDSRVDLFGVGGPVVDRRSDLLFGEGEQFGGCGNCDLAAAWVAVDGLDHLPDVGAVYQCGSRSGWAVAERYVGVFGHLGIWADAQSATLSTSVTVAGRSRLIGSGGSA